MNVVFKPIDLFKVSLEIGACVACPPCPADQPLLPLLNGR